MKRHGRKECEKLFMQVYQRKGTQVKRRGMALIHKKKGEKTETVIRKTGKSVRKENQVQTQINKNQNNSLRDKII